MVGRKGFQVDNIVLTFWKQSWLGSPCPWKSSPRSATGRLTSERQSKTCGFGVSRRWWIVFFFWGMDGWMDIFVFFCVFLGGMVFVFFGGEGVWHMGDVNNFQFQPGDSSFDASLIEEKGYRNQLNSYRSQVFLSGWEALVKLGYVR